MACLGRLLRDRARQADDAVATSLFSRPFRMGSAVAAASPLMALRRPPCGSRGVGQVPFQDLGRGIPPRPPPRRRCAPSGASDGVRARA